MLRVRWLVLREPDPAALVVVLDVGRRGPTRRRWRRCGAELVHLSERSRNLVVVVAGVAGAADALRVVFIKLDRQVLLDGVLEPGVVR